MAQYLNAFSGRQFIDANGNPYVGAKLFTYVAGSSTKVTTTKDSAGASNHTNPIILNARGEPADGAGASQAIWQAGGSSTKLVLAPASDSDPPLSSISTWDNLSGINDTTTTIDQWITGPTPTFVSATQFTLVGDQTTIFHVGRRIKATVTAGTFSGLITVSAYTSLTTITVVIDSGSLDSGLSIIAYGILTAVNPSVPGVRMAGADWTHAGIVTMSSKSLWMAEGASVASVADCNIWTTDGNTVHVTGAVTISDWGTAPQAGARKRVIFDGAPQLTYNATTNDMNTGTATYTVSAGDEVEVYARSASSYKVTIFRYNELTLRMVGPIATTSGTTVELATNLPTWIRRVHLLFRSVSTSGSSNVLIQIASAGGYEAGFAGYTGAGSVALTATVETAAFVAINNGFNLHAGSGATATMQRSGMVTLALMDPSVNAWVCAGQIARSDASDVLMSVAGFKSVLTGSLIGIRLNTVNGTDTFDFGSVSILYD